MKANSNFREQVGQVTSWFKEWSECEQTVALYSLLKKLTPAQAKFLDQVLQQSLAECADVKQMQTKANDEAFIAGLFNEDKGKVIVQLLQLLPLLQAGNEMAKAEYLRLIPDVLSHTIDHGVNIEESRQLLSYSLIHPAITQEERSKFRMWLGYLEERFTYNISHHTTTPTLPPHTSTSSSGAHDPLTASHSAPVSASHSTEGLNNLYGSAAPSPSVSSGNGWHCHGGHVNHPFGPDSGGGAGGMVGSGVGGDSGAGGGSNTGGHQSLRATNSHAGAFGVAPQHHLNGHVALHATSSAPPQFETLAGGGSVAGPSSQSQGSGSQQQQLNRHTPLRRTASVVPHNNNINSNCNNSNNNPLPLRVQNPEKIVTDWLQMHPAVQGTPLMVGGEGGGGGKGGRSSSSRTAEHAPLSPQSSVTSSGSGGSESHQEEGPQPVRDSFVEEGSGMREVPVWLKTLRLHKYSYLFRQMTYEDMLNITEEWLEARKVTKGARHKIVISIQKLRERQKLLCEFEKRIMQGGPIREVLGELKSMLNTPIKAFAGTPTTGDPSPSPLGGPPSPCTPDAEIAEGNLPGQFVRLMGKVCTQLLTTSTRDDDSLQLYFQLIDKCVQHEAFSHKQKSLLTVWKQQAQMIWQPPLHKYDRKQKSWGHTFPLHPMVARTSSGSRSRLGPSPSAPQQWSFGSRRAVVVGVGGGGGQGGGGGGGVNLHAPVQRNSSLNTAVLNKPGLLEAKQPVCRTQSAPLRSSQLTLSQSLQPPGGEQATDTEINARLDSLCRSMTEHALGGDSGDKGSTF
ncbi:protein Smaug homolog 1-like isoform X2 [Babylonia areolata]|uniref:protein Smaug homolog 1-like isoform X2 n=1 Tax=Babylonia areolata TaxID=304850 RepID=UPI003FD6250D